MKLSRKDLRVLIENVVLEQTMLDKVKEKIQPVVQKIRQGIVTAINPESEKAVEPEVAISELERMQNLVNESPETRALGIAQSKDLVRAKSIAQNRGRNELSRMISSKRSSDGNTSVQLSSAKLSGSRQIAAAFVMDETTREYTVYVVMEMKQ